MIVLNLSEALYFQTFCTDLAEVSFADIYQLIIDLSAGTKTQKSAR
jgi:hypothetical protein